MLKNIKLVYVISDCKWLTASYSKTSWKHSKVKQQTSWDYKGRYVRGIMMYATEEWTAESHLVLKKTVCTDKTKTE